MKKIAIYIGANRGYGLSSLVDNFDEIHVFEPDIEIFEELKQHCLNFNNYRSDIILNNAACYLENNKKILHITENRVSTSLSEVDTSTFDTIGWHSGGKPSIKQIEVETVNLYDYLLENNIEEIEYLLTDTQGSDLTILKTIKPYIEKRKIKTIFCETHGNGKSLYVDLNNEFDGFKELLSDNYEISYYSFDGECRPKDYVVQDTDPYWWHNEWDTCWVLKEV